TSFQPRPCSAASTALPCTSSTPGFRNTWTTAFIRLPRRGRGTAKRWRGLAGSAGAAPFVSATLSPIHFPRGGKRDGSSVDAPLNHGWHLFHDPQAPRDLGVAFD